MVISKMSEYATSIARVAEERVHLKRLQMATNLLRLMEVDLREETERIRADHAENKRP